MRVCFKGCDSYSEVFFLEMLKVATNETTTLYLITCVLGCAWQLW